MAACPLISSSSTLHSSNEPSLTQASSKSLVSSCHRLATHVLMDQHANASSLPGEPHPPGTLELFSGESTGRARLGVLGEPEAERRESKSADDSDCPDENKEHGKLVPLPRPSDDFNDPLVRRATPCPGLPSAYTYIYSADVVDAAKVVELWPSHRHDHVHLRRVSTVATVLLWQSALTVTGCPRRPYFGLRCCRS